MLRRTLLAALAVGATATNLPRPARAVVTYVLVDPVYGVTGIGSGPARFPLRTGFAFTVSDAAVARGSFKVSFSGNNGQNVLFGGDVADFVSFAAIDQTVAAGQSFKADRSSLNVTFGAGGVVNSLALTYQGDSESLFLSSTAPGLVTGTYGSDFNDCGPLSCSVSGRIATAGSGGGGGTGTRVPEPMSVALLGMGLLGATMVRRAG